MQPQRAEKVDDIAKHGDLRSYKVQTARRRRHTLAFLIFGSWNIRKRLDTMCQYGNNFSFDYSTWDGPPANAFNALSRTLSEGHVQINGRQKADFGFHNAEDRPLDVTGRLGCASEGGESVPLKSGRSYRQRRRRRVRYPGYRRAWAGYAM